MRNKRGPRINQADFKALLMAHSKLDAMIRALRGTNWAGAQPCIMLAAEIDMWVVELYNRAEPAFIPAETPPVVDLPGDGQVEIPSAPAAAAPRAIEPGPEAGDKFQRCIHGLPAEQHCGLCAVAAAEDAAIPTDK